MEDLRVCGRRWIGVTPRALPAVLLGLGLACPWASAEENRPAILPPVEAVRLEGADAKAPKAADPPAAAPAVKDEKPQAPAEPVQAVAAHVVDLATCKQIALVRQPSMAAARASLATAQARAAGLQRLPNIPLVARDLPIRRQQACLGVSIASAGLEQAQWDTLYNVTRCYLAAVYARQQLDFADGSARTLRDLRETARRFEDKEEDAEQLTLFLHVVAGRREAAVQGVDRALAALREAVGLEPGAVLQVPDTRLPNPAVALTREQVLHLALSRRGELVQASLAAQVTCREVEAQALRCLHPTVRTFASGSDIHATPIPAAERGAEYHPAALAPEMPPFLVGDRAARVEQAQALSARANSLTEKVRNLITLEADDAWFRYVEGSRKLPRLQEAATLAHRRADRLVEDIKNPDIKPRFYEASNALALSAQVGVEATEAHFQMLLSLAALERITAGGFSAGLDSAPARPSPEPVRAPKETKP